MISTAADRAGFQGRRVLVCGTGIAGRSAVRALQELHAEVVVSGQGELPVDLGGVEFIGDAAVVPDGVQLVITSPGLPPWHPLLRDASARDIEVVGELELAWRLRGLDPAPWLMVTGTNGKTTTVGMVQSIVRAAGRSCLAVGNVGVSIIDAVRAGHHEILVVEASSFQLAFSTSLRPRAGVVLNLAEDHLDWHGSMAAYADAKTKVWRGELAVANADDDTVMHLLGEREDALLFTVAEPKPGQLGVRNGMLLDRGQPDEPELFSVADIRPVGLHNVSNALAAAALARTVGASTAAIAAGLTAFEPDPHRNSFVATVAGIDYVDDSKATNPHAAAASLASYDRVVWIAGGQLKGADVEPLVRRFAPSMVAAVVLGQDRALVTSALMRHAPDLPVISIDRTDDGAMSNAVEAAAAFARAGDVVLLAPAAASRDMFSGYDQRGRAFAAAVRTLAVRAEDVIAGPEA